MVIVLRLERIAHFAASTLCEVPWSPGDGAMRLEGQHLDVRTRQCGYGRAALNEKVVTTTSNTGNAGLMLPPRLLN